MSSDCTLTSINVCYETVTKVRPRRGPRRRPVPKKVLTNFGLEFDKPWCKSIGEYDEETCTKYATKGMNFDPEIVHTKMSKFIESINFFAENSLKEAINQ